MKLKLFILGFVFVFLASAQALFSVGIEPSVRGDLALQQFADPSRITDSASRAIDRIPFHFVWVGYAGLCCLVLFSDIKNKLTQVKEKCDEVK